jgi:cation transport regulator
MPYPTNDALPASVRHALPRHAQDIWRAAFNSAWRSLRPGEDEAKCHRIAWAAVKRAYVKQGRAWVPRRSALPDG